MLPASVDPRFALDAASQSDLVRKKIAMDAMRKRVSGGPSEEAKLREACEGFESIFLQKMWEQMRKNVKKEGYLHSKDEEAYQSMFDVELAKKMASAGGIGLADMLYEQLGQRLHNASKTTGVSGMREPLPIGPARPPLPETPVASAPASAPAPEDLYADIPEESAPAEQGKTALDQALEEMAASRDPGIDPANASYPMFDLETGAPMNPVAAKRKEDAAPKREYDMTPLPERVSAPGKAKPSNALGAASRAARHARRNAETQADRAAAPAAAPEAPVAGKPGWPVRGEMISAYGRGEAGWNTGVAFAAEPGSPVIAPRAGTVVFAGEKDGVGHLVLDHGDGLTSHYANVTSSLAPGDAISGGMEFAQVSHGSGAVGDAGARPAVRVGFEVRRGELAINPDAIAG